MDDFGRFQFNNPCPTCVMGSWCGYSDPTVTIIQPTSAGIYITSANTISMAGISSDDVNVVSVTWSNSSGGSGTASGTTIWSISNISLFCGDHNIISVTAEDNEGNTGADILTVDVPPCPPGGL